MTELLIQTLNALQYSMVLFLLSIGLTVIFGLLNFVNLAHGSIYAIAAYVGWSVVQATGSFWVALAAGPVAAALVGAALYFGLIRWMRSYGPLYQVLVTFGLIFVFLDVIRFGWGDLELSMAYPALLSGSVSLGETYSYHAYRLFIIALGLIVMLALHLLLSRTSIGAIIRASVENGAMASCMGVNVERVFFTAFCVGCALAGLGGVAAAPLAALKTTLGIFVLIPTLVVVVIGGLGSLRGAILGSLLVGFIDTFGRVLLPDLAGVLVYGLLALTLILRPQGLFPARA